MSETQTQGETTGGGCNVRSSDLLADAPKQGAGPLYAVFTGAGGYSGEKEKARAIFEYGHKYEVESGSMGQSHTHIKLRGIEGNWNSCLFDVDIYHPMIENAYELRRKSANAAFQRQRRI